MNTTVVLGVLCAVLAVCAIVLACVFAKRKKRIRTITRSIDQYLETGVVTDFSTRDDLLAQLQNAVFDLENRLEREKQNTRERSRQNTEFISDVSHQLKTPLAGLRLYCEMEHAANPSDHTQKELALVEKMEDLIARLLRLEKIRTDAYTMNFQTYDAADLIDPLIAQFRHLFPKKQYSVTARGKVRCDQEWLGEAVGNLIKNASEHTAPDGCVAVSVQEKNGAAQITVQDNGGGVPKQDLPLLFTRFHNAQKALPSSAGIGLAITKAGVEKHHGTVSAENKNGGLCVVICLPQIDGSVAI